MKRKLLHTIFYCLSAILWALTVYCWETSATPNSTNCSAYNTSEAVLENDGLPLRQEGDLCNQITLPQHLCGKQQRVRQCTQFPNGGLDKPTASHKQGNEYRHEQTIIKTSRRESAPFSISASRLYYVIALRRIVI